MAFFISAKDKVLEYLPQILAEAQTHGMKLTVHVLKDETYCRPVFAKLYAVITLVPGLSLLKLVVSETAFVEYMLDLRPQIIEYLEAEATATVPEAAALNSTSPLTPEAS